MLQDLEFYACLVFAALVVVFFLLVMIRFRFGVSTGNVFLVLIVFAAGLITGPWLFTFLSVYSPR